MSRIFPAVTALALVVPFSAVALPVGVPNASHGDNIALGVPAAGRTQLPVKDCTPYNSRYGYYGNPWCSERERLIWELYTSGRLARSGRR